MNISSIVVKTKAEDLEAVKASLEASGLCEIHFSDEMGRIVCTLEGDDNADESKKLREIMDLPLVVSAEFSYTYSDGNEPDTTDG